MLRILLFLLLSTNIAIASTVTTPYVYSTNDTVTNVKLNSNQNAITNVVNGGLDNNNANTTSGYHFFQSVGTLPTAGNQGSVYYLTSDNTLNFDTGSTFIKSVVTASNPTVNSVVFWNGSAWATGSASSLLPSGIILEWSGTIATIPSGFVLCNGTNGTPDLRNKFIVGADADVGGVAKSTVSGSALQTGGSATKDLRHTHSVPRDGWGDSTGEVASGRIATKSDGGGGNLIHATADNTSGTGGSATQDVLNPYYALAYIMKT